MTDNLEAEARRVAAGLKKAQCRWMTTEVEVRAPAAGHDPRPMTFPPMNTFEVLVRHGLVDRVGQLRDRGLAVKRVLETGHG